MEQQRRKDLRADTWGAGGIAVAYVVMASLWILLSDRLLQALLPAATLNELTWLQTAKGLFFVAATAALLWGLVLRRLRIIRRAEIERSAVEGRLATFADNLPGVAYIKDAQGRFVFMRGRMPEGMPPAESLVGKDSTAILEPATFQRMKIHDEEVIGGNRVSQLVEPVPIPDGTTRYYLIHRFPLRGPRGENWLGGVALDVTERTIAEGRIRELARELEAANRLKDQFLSNLSHELRTPITAIRLWIDVLKGSGPNDIETIREAAGMIEDSAAAQTRLIEDLLDITRILAGKLKVEPRPMGLAEVVRATAAMLEPMAEERLVAIQVQLPPSEPAPVIGDARRLQQVVWNLLNNAIKFSPPRGTVRLVLVCDSANCLLTVADQGIGISPDLLPHLFERFRQADTTRTRTEGGVGIGLSLVKYLVEAHGGEVVAESDGEGKGATFSVRLPVAQGVEIVHMGGGGVAESRSGGLQGDAAGASAPDATTPPPRHPATASLPQSSVTPPPPLQGLRVLLVEDNADSRTGMMLLLRRAGATVQTADEVDAALAVADGPFDVLLSDIGLPDRDGCELVEELRRRPEWRDKPALAISAYALPEDRERALKAGFDGFVVKPVDPDKLIDLVLEWIERKKRHEAAMAS